MAGSGCTPAESENTLDTGGGAVTIGTALSARLAAGAVNAGAAVAAAATAAATCCTSGAAAGGASLLALIGTLSRDPLPTG